MKFTGKLVEVVNIILSEGPSLRKTKKKSHVLFPVYILAFNACIYAN